MVADPTPPVAGADPAQPAPPPPTPQGPPTLTDILRSVVENLGGPPEELSPDVWGALADRITAKAANAPPPPSFSTAATRVLEIARDEKVDMNELVGAVQRDGAIASALLRVANSPAFAPAVPITTLRGAISLLGISQFIALVLGSAGRSLYEVTTHDELSLFPEMWQTMFDDAMANAFAAGRVALDVRGSRGERALLAGLLIDVGRPLALRMLASLVREGMRRPDEPLVLATLDAIAPQIGARVITGLKLPEELRVACMPDAQNPDAHIARLIAAIGAMQRRSPRMWSVAGEVRTYSERLKLDPYAVRAMFSLRAQYRRQAGAMFGRG